MRRMVRTTLAHHAAEKRAAARREHWRKAKRAGCALARRARHPLFTTPKFLRGASKAAGVGAPEQGGKGGQAADSKEGEEAAAKQTAKVRMNPNSNPNLTLTLTLTLP